MSELGEVFGAMKQESRERRTDHRAYAPKRLHEACIPFTSHNGGAHLVIRGPRGPVADFWPGTGLFAFRNVPPGQGKGRGIANLIKRCRERGLGR